MNGAIICHTRCWSCICDDHFEPPQWHRWADADDIDHAQKNGYPSPIDLRCACYCADAEREVTP